MSGWGMENGTNDGFSNDGFNQRIGSEALGDGGAKFGKQDLPSTSCPVADQQMATKSSNSSAGLLREMKNDLECTICRELFREPKQLLCGHTFCQECLSKVASSQATSFFNMTPGLVSGFDCPQCRRNHRGRVQDIVTNYVLKDMVEKLKEAQKGIGEDDDAFLNCSKCAKLTIVSELFLCESCIPSSSSSRVIPEHKNQGSQKLCSICIIKLHNGHTLKPFQEILARKAFEEIYSKAKVLEKKYDENKQRINDVFGLAVEMFSKFKEELGCSHLPILSRLNDKIAQQAHLQFNEEKLLNWHLNRNQKLTTRLGKFSSELVAFLEQYATFGDYYNDFLRMESNNFDNQELEEMKFRQIRQNQRSGFIGSPPPTLNGFACHRRHLLTEPIMDAFPWSPTRYEPITFDLNTDASSDTDYEQLSVTRMSANDDLIGVNDETPRDPSTHNEVAQQHRRIEEGTNSNENNSLFGAHGGARSAFEYCGGIAFVPSRAGGLAGRGGYGRGGSNSFPANSIRRDGASLNGSFRPMSQGHNRGGFSATRKGSRGGRIAHSTDFTNTTRNTEGSNANGTTAAGQTMFGVMETHRRGRGRGGSGHGNVFDGMVTGIGGPPGSVAMISRDGTDVLPSSTLRLDQSHSNSNVNSRRARQYRGRALGTSYFHAGGRRNDNRSSADRSINPCSRQENLDTSMNSLNGRGDGFGYN